MKRIIIAIMTALCLHTPAWANQLKGLRVAPAAEKTRIVFDMAERPVYSYSITDSQLIVDLKSVSSSTAKTERTNKLGPVIKSVRRATAQDAGAVRIIFELNSAAPLQVFTLGPQQQYGHRLVIDLSHNGGGVTAKTSGGSRASSPATTAASVTTASTSTSRKPVSGRIIQMSDEVGTSSQSATAKTASTATAVASSSSLSSASAGNASRSGASVSGRNTATTRQLPSSDIQIKEEVISTEVRRSGTTTASSSSPSPALDSKSTSGAAVMDSYASSRNDGRAKPFVPEQDIVPGPTARAQDVSTASRSKSATASSGSVVIAIDAGHGGKDPGAIGQNGTYEKNVTLAIARELAAMINRQPGMKAVLTRSGDYFVDLDARSEIARRHKASLLVSIHADSVDNAVARGASVWILSNKRVDREMNKLLGQQQKHSQLLGGAGKVIAEAEPNPYLAQTILDLSWDNARSEGYNIGEEVLRQIGRVARLHKSKPVHASLAVLKAPDIPSLLIESGFISNPYEERQLASENYQRQLARAIFSGMRGYYSDNPPEGVRIADTGNSTSGDTASAGNKRHVVKTGESLSGLAQRYGVSRQKLKSYNSLNSEVLKIGQVLYIPTS